MGKCTACGNDAGFMMAMCQPCLDAEAAKLRSSAAANETTAQARREAAAAVILTTAPAIEGYRVAKTLDVVTAECVYGMNMFRDFFAAVTDLTGGRSSSAEAVLKDARKTCLAELRLAAHAIGADAVIAVSLVRGGPGHPAYLIEARSFGGLSGSPSRGSGRRLKGDIECSTPRSWRAKATHVR